LRESALLGNLVESIKSANAGASLITFDMFFHDIEDLRRAEAAVTREVVARLYRVSVDDVAVFVLPAFLGMKVTIPRLTMFGSTDERDFDGVQQHTHLLEVPV
jgi:hypothetical protein